MPKRKTSTVKPTTMKVPDGFTLLYIVDKTTGGQTMTLLRTMEQGGVIMNIREHCEQVFKVETAYDWDTSELRIVLHPKQLFQLAKLIQEWAN